jgi:hypothetical protein
MTTLGLGKTALMIWASWLTVKRISRNRAVNPGSAVGGGASGSAIVSHLLLASSVENVQVSDFASLTVLSLLSQRLSFLKYPVFRYEEVMLIDVYLHAGCTTVEVQESLCAVLNMSIIRTLHLQPSF